MAIRPIDGPRVASPGAPQPAETDLGVQQVVRQPRALTTEDRKSLGPAVWPVVIERGVIEPSHHLARRPFRSRTGEHGRPGFTLTGHKPGTETLPFDGEFLVRPRHIHLDRAHVGAILADLRQSHGEPASHLLADLLLQPLLGAAGIAPVILQGPSIAFDLHECAAGVVSSSPQRGEHLAGLHRPFRGEKDTGLPDPVPPFLRVDDPHGFPRGDLPAEAILRLEHGAVDAGRQSHGHP